MTAVNTALTDRSAPSAVIIGHCPGQMQIRTRKFTPGVSNQICHSHLKKFGLNGCATGFAHRPTALNNSSLDRSFSVLLEIRCLFIHLYSYPIDQPPYFRRCAWQDRAVSLEKKRKKETEVLFIFIFLLRNQIEMFTMEAIEYVIYCDCVVFVPVSLKRQVLAHGVQ